ncbi:MAG: class I SAM-dependent methyltransferase [Pseudomonadota bacterium]
MINNKLLTNIYFGSELDKLDKGTRSTEHTLKQIDPKFGVLSDECWEEVRAIVKEFFKKKLVGKFGGPITAGDAFFIAAYLAAIKPRTVVEVGVCSGVSSAFILHAGHRLGLCRSRETFLHSMDLLRFHGPEQNKVGQVVELNFATLMKYWKLSVEITTPQVVLGAHALQQEISECLPTLAFIDANHMHPWPTLDVLAISRILVPGSWILMQDTQVMERWIANCVERGVPSPKPCRGVNLVASNWNGTKAIGWDMCYNMGAIKTHSDAAAQQEFIRHSRMYPFEVGTAASSECAQYLDALSR